jgi:hypothetical protein
VRTAADVRVAGNAAPPRRTGSAACAGERAVKRERGVLAAASGRFRFGDSSTALAGAASVSEVTAAVAGGGGGELRDFCAGDEERTRPSASATL